MTDQVVSVFNRDPFPISGTVGTPGSGTLSGGFLFGGRHNDTGDEPQIDSSSTGIEYTLVCSNVVGTLEFDAQVTVTYKGDGSVTFDFVMTIKAVTDVNFNATEVIGNSVYHVTWAGPLNQVATAILAEHGVGRPMTAGELRTWTAQTVMVHP